MSLFRPRLRALASVAAPLALAAALGTTVPGPALSLTAAPGRTAVSVDDLKAEVDRSSAQLAAATERWEKGQQALNLAVQTSVSAGQDLDTLVQDAADARQRISQFASSLYRNPFGPGVNSLLTADLSSYAQMFHTRSTLGYDLSARQADLSLLQSAAAVQARLHQQRDDAVVAVAKLQKQLDEQLAGIQSQLADQQRLLDQALAELQRQREAALRVGTGDGALCQGPVPDDAINGFLPISALCALPGYPGHRLAYGPAQAFALLAAAFEAGTGQRLCLTDSYRDYAGQVSVFARKPTLAATPGRSNHGLGKAVDLCGGIQAFSTPQHAWMDAHAGEYGWVHPSWAEPGGSKPEAWHWEWNG